MKLTIILTVYNKENYLHKAFDALLCQEAVQKDDYEVLVVNDGSTDGSSAIIKEYARQDSRIRVLNQENQGLSMARNNGVDAAKGEYVWFVDADDVISQESVRLLCDSMASQPDVIPIYAKDDDKEEIRNQIPASVKTGRDVLLSRKWELCGVFWIIRKKFLQQNKLSFYPGIYHEDAEFTPRMLFHAASVKVLPEVLYTVFHDPNSITGLPRPKRAFDLLIVARRLSSFVSEFYLRNTPVGRIIDDEASMMINNGLSLIVVNSEADQRSFNNTFLKDKNGFLQALRSSIQKKYRLEGILFELFPKHIVRVYKIMKLFS